MKLVASFERKVGLPDYSNETASITMEVEVPDDASGDQLEDEMFATINRIKTVVYAQLGFLYGTEEATGRIIELGLPAKSISKPPRTPVEATKPAVSPTPPPTPPTTDKEALWRDLQANPGNWSDNTSTKKGNQPDYKHKTTGQALWLNRAPCWFLPSDDEEPF